MKPKGSPKKPQPQARPQVNRKPAEEKTGKSGKDEPKRAGQGTKPSRAKKPRKNRKLCAKHRRQDAKRKKKRSS